MMFVSAHYCPIKEGQRLYALSRAAPTTSINTSQDRNAAIGQFATKTLQEKPSDTSQKFVNGTEKVTALVSTKKQKRSWSTSEECKLIWLVYEHPQATWSKISALLAKNFPSLPPRTSNGCEKRYRALKKSEHSEVKEQFIRFPAPQRMGRTKSEENHLIRFICVNPQVPAPKSSGSWTTSEECHLMRFVHEHPQATWSEISALLTEIFPSLPPRTSEACRAKYSIIVNSSHADARLTGFPMGKARHCAQHE